MTEKHNDSTAQRGDRRVVVDGDPAFGAATVIRQEYRLVKYDADEAVKHYDWRATRSITLSEAEIEQVADALRKCKEKAPP